MSRQKKTSRFERRDAFKARSSRRATSRFHLLRLLHPHPFLPFVRLAIISILRLPSTDLFPIYNSRLSSVVIKGNKAIPSSCLDLLNLIYDPARCMFSARFFSLFMDSSRQIGVGKCARLLIESNLKLFNASRLFHCSLV